MSIFETMHHLKALLTTEEQREFMETILQQADQWRIRYSRLYEEKKELEKEVESLEDTIEELEIDDEPYANQHDLGIGDISWETGSFELGELFELVCEKVTATSHKKVTSLLNAL
jgi:hypothetical protein